jgi:DNA-binding transcriptional MerR regulator
MEKSLKMLTIQDVSQRLDVSTHTLRFWEKELAGVIVPLRTKGGQRRYTLEHLFVIDEIKRLKAKGLSLIDIRRELDHRYNSHGEKSNPENIDHLANQIADLVKSTVRHFLEGNKEPEKSDESENVKT